MRAILVKTKEEVNMEEENDEALLFYMGMRNDDPSGANAAWAEFYRRHKRYLNCVCRKACKYLPDPKEDARDLCSATFERAYERACTFKPLDNGDIDHMRRRVRAWLGEIARNLLIDLTKDNKDQPKLISLTEISDEEPESKQIDISNILSSQMKLIHEALNTLSEQQRIVVLMSFQWYEFGKSNQRLPNGIATEIAKTIDSTPENVRQIRKRALEKIRVFTETHTK